jgi:hypothetical protein
LHLNEKQISKLDKYITEINNDQTLKHKIEKINLLLTNSNQINGSMSILNDSLNNEQDIVNPSLNIDDSINSNEKINYDLIESLLIDLRKFIAMNVFNWNTKMTEFFKKSKSEDVIITYSFFLINFYLI